MYLHVRYLVCGSHENVEVNRVLNFKLPIKKNHTYKVFWSPEHESIKDFEKRMKKQGEDKIPTISGKLSGNLPGYYKALILEWGDSEEELLQKLERKRPSCPSLKSIVDDSSSANEAAGPSKNNHNQLLLNQQKKNQAERDKQNLLAANKINLNFDTDGTSKLRAARPASLFEDRSPSDRDDFSPDEDDPTDKLYEPPAKKPTFKHLLTQKEASPHESVTVIPESEHESSSNSDSDDHGVVIAEKMSPEKLKKASLPKNRKPSFSLETPPYTPLGHGSTTSPNTQPISHPGIPGSAFGETPKSAVKTSLQAEKNGIQRSENRFGNKEAITNSSTKPKEGNNSGENNASISPEERNSRRVEIQLFQEFMKAFEERFFNKLDDFLRKIRANTNEPATSTNDIETTEDDWLFRNKLDKKKLEDGKIKLFHDIYVSTKVWAAASNAKHGDSILVKNFVDIFWSREEQAARSLSGKPSNRNINKPKNADESAEESDGENFKTAVTPEKKDRVKELFKAWIIHLSPNITPENLKLRLNGFDDYVREKLGSADRAEKRKRNKNKNAAKIETAAENKDAAGDKDAAGNRDAAKPESNETELTEKQNDDENSII